jgi:2-polyprenyl-3-methyl-5-hydroxy-6-metoxy-1,4-benzoquinol methylase
MWSVLLLCEQSDAARDQLSSDLWDVGTAGIIDERDGLRAFFEESVTPEMVATALRCSQSEMLFEYVHASAPTPTFLEPDPILVGSKFVIAAPGCEARLPLGRVQLRVDAGSAFGTGRHETTQLMLEAIEDLVAPGSVVLDVGCGSGILSQAAAALGATVYSCDIDEHAVAVARSHSREVFRGSADAVREKRMDVVLANISTKVIDHLAFYLHRVCRPDGYIIICGFLKQNPPSRFRPLATIERGDWMAWVCRPDPDLQADASDQPNLHPRDWWL